MLHFYMLTPTNTNVKLSFKKKGHPQRIGLFYVILICTFHSEIRNYHTNQYMIIVFQILIWILFYMYLDNYLDYNFLLLVHVNFHVL